MKTLLFLSISGFAGCNNQSGNPDGSKAIDKILKPATLGKPDNLKYYTTQDTVIITTEIGDTLKYGKKEFNQIIDQHPEFTNDLIENPDQAYHCNGSGFGSEAGQDGYFMLYAYFLKKKNDEAKYAQRRKKLINLYSNINSLFGHFEYGGTYFGHQQARILGYAEYSIYLYKQNEPYGISKTYDIKKQKELYIKSLRQLVSDESTIDMESLGNEKIARTKKLSKIIDELDKAITDNFYLRRTQEFHYYNYEYY